MRLGLRGACAALAFFFAAPTASGEEGMWTFDNFPVERMQREMNWAPDQAWRNRVAAGIARIEGLCSASVVSGEGLVLTNQHCIRECVAELSSDRADYLANGFLPRTRAEERRCEGMAVQRLISVADVTAQIDEATAGVAREVLSSTLYRTIGEIETACRGDDAAIRCEVASLYRGGRYALHRYRRYEDVRLAFAPETEMAHFGGEPDNFNFPRYSLDFAFLRLYENGAPAMTPEPLRLRFSPLSEDEIVLVAGFPGFTSRQSSVAQLAFQRDHILPFRLGLLAELRGRLLAYSALGVSQARVAADNLLSAENSYKAFNGRRLALVDTASFARVAEAEADLRARVRRNRAAERDMGDAWADVERAQAAYRGFYVRHQLLELRAGGGPVGSPGASELFNWARDLVRAGDERAKPNAERLPRYSETRLGAVEQSVLANRPVHGEFEEVLLAFWLSKMREHLTMDDPAVRAALGSESPEAAARRIVAGTRLADPAERERLWRGGAAAVQASDDPMIVFVRAWDGEARAVHQRYLREYERPAAQASERIAQARFRAFGTSMYPDATFTPRLTYGRVRGWTELDGRVIGPFTRISGLYERAADDHPYRLSRRWIEARPRLAGDTIFGVATSNDITGGNSGSPLLDREGRVVGVVFDGNMHSLGGDFFYDGTLNRAISVATTTMRASMIDVYGADALVAELDAD